MQGKTELIDSLYENGFLKNDEEIILSDAFEEAFIGTSVTNPKFATYDFFKALECVIKEAPELSFDEALEWLEEFVSLKIKNNENMTPVFIKTTVKKN